MPIGNATSGQEGQTDDHSTYYATYVWGGVTVGYQVSEIDVYNSSSDHDNTAIGVLYAVNDELSISYQDRTNDLAGTSQDEEIDGWSAAYTMGSMTITGISNSTDNVAGTDASNDSYREVTVAFAF